MNSGSLSSKTRCSAQGLPQAAKAKLGKAPARLGVMAPDDPFWWFCQQNFALYTSGCPNVPRHFLNDGISLSCKYSDFVSRTGTPEPKMIFGGAERKTGDDENDSHGIGKTKPVPPAICLCQPTELSS